MAKASGGGSFAGGFVGGILLSALAFVGSAVLVPPAPAPVVEVETETEPALPPRLPTLDQQTVPDSVTQQAEAVRPQTAEPQVPASAPAVDPAINQGSAALGMAPSLDVGLDSGAPAPRPAAPSGPARPAGAGLSAPSTESAALSAGATAPARPRADVGAPGGALEPASAPATTSPNVPTAALPSMNADGSLSRPRVTGIQPEVGTVRQDAAPEADTAAAPPPPSIPEAAPVEEPVAPEQAPRRLYAANFNAPENQPLISVILVDGGNESFSLDSLAAISFPMTIAVPADARDAAERARAFRAAGFEVLALVPDDIAASMAAMDDQGVLETLAGIFEAVPEAVGILDARGGAIGGDSRVTRTTLDYLTLTGHVLLTQAGQGFNQTGRLAAAAGVPSATVERTLDSSGGGAAMVGSLQRVALDARSRGGALLIGQGDQATLTSVLTWAFSPSSREVSLAPVTPLLDRFADQN